MFKLKDDVFVIEVLKPIDYACFAADGMQLVCQLQSLGFDAFYERCYTFESFKKALDDFMRLGYRYLHISCHGNKEGISFYDDVAWNSKDESGKPLLQYKEEVVENDEIARSFKSACSTRRFVFSGCELGNEQFIGSMFKENRGLYSIIAPLEPLPMYCAAPLWLSFYTKLMIGAKKNSRTANLNIHNTQMRNILSELSDVFRVRCGFGYYSPAVNRSGRESVKFVEMCGRGNRAKKEKIIYEYPGEVKDASSDVTKQKEKGK